MASFRDAFKGKYLKADDLGTSKPIVKIESVEFEEIGSGDKKESKLVVHFAGKDKGIVLNMINAETIAEIAGTDDYEDWAGTLIRLFATKTEFQGKRVPCIRVDAPPAATVAQKAKARKPEPEPEPDEADLGDSELEDAPF